ncbi:hypothetical protein [Aegicerativicinus sediminis]|uniref:hypothetical protein n=1 Tax=Aegicerativicinus sediminis TaxID=2893202 RepID=UPI001E4DB5E2|nr:hypothetical protein [Aegicerativicinus sediminis]
MLRLSLIIFSIFTINCSIAQERGIKVFNDQQSKEFLIKENKRIRIKTIDDHKISGRFKIVDDETILIRKRTIKLSEIEKLKKHPLGMSIIINGILYYYAAALTAAVLTTYAETGEALALILLAPAPGLIYGGIKSPNILKGYNTENNWQFQITGINE